MVREIVHDPMLLAGKSVPATQANKQIITDLMDTLKAHLGCLSLLGGPRKTTRYEEIEVEYLDANFKPKKDKFTGYTAQIIQHELDHVNGILI